MASEITIKQGDCIILAQQMESECVDAVITDPPYGMNFQSGQRSEKLAVLKNDDKPFIWFLKEAYRVMKPDSCLVCFCDWKNQEAFRFAIEIAGFKLRSQIVWDRMVHGMGNLKAAFAPSHDIAWFATKGRYAFKGRRPKDVLSHKRVPSNLIVHPTMKPIALMEEILNSTTAEGDVVLDMFLGSGSTMIACQNLNRKGIGFELDPVHFEIAEKRLDANLLRLQLEDIF